MAELENTFNLITSLRPLDNRKNTLYHITHPLIGFWFVFVYDKFSHYSLKDASQIMTDIKSKFNTFFGKRFEDICKDFLIGLNKKNKLPFQLDYLSNWFGSARENDERKEIEIDLVGLNDKQNKILFVECKWTDNVNPSSLLQELREKSKYVQWHANGREEYFYLIAKSFSKNIEEKNVLLLDLKDMRKELLET
ncbi:MAG: DUF234 domain-containing protein [Candidatus Woesearchaeota archaeon]|nr:DUF234 domain-containing protein [Candidatus Woesearchaeota archaeon]